ncbi:hypothetical protein ACJ8BL_10605 [Klebsiella pneumoniae]
MEHISGDSFIQKEARPLFDVNTLQHLPDGFAVMTGLGVARMAFSSPLRVERREIPLQRFPVLAKTDPRRSSGPRPTAAGRKRMMILRGFTDGAGAVQRQPRETTGAERGKTRLTLRWLREELCSGGAGCAAAGDCGGAAGLPLPRQRGGERAAGRTKYPVDGRQVSVCRG